MTISSEDLAQLRRRVLSDAPLHAQLAALPDREQFSARLLRLAAEQGLEWTLADVEQALREGRRTLPPPENDLPDPARLAGWTPVRIHWQTGAPLVEWCWLGELRLTEPFFEETARLALRHPFNLLFRRTTSIAGPAALQATHPGLPPRGLILHMSRCGSTLVAQLLAALPQNVVVAEAPPIDAVLRAHLRDATITDEQRIAWLRALLGALGQRRHGPEQHLFIKFDSWHTLDLPLIERAFPGVPWIFVYREPLEVLVSHQRLRGSQMVPGLIEPRLFGLDERARQMPLDDYCAHVLQRICAAAARHYRPDRARLINYRQLPEAAWTFLPEVFGLQYAPADLQRMRAAAQRNAKNPSAPFAADTFDKRAAATAHLRHLAATRVQPIYERLEALREGRK